MHESAGPPALHALTKQGVPLFSFAHIGSTPQRCITAALPTGSEVIASSLPLVRRF
jgi:hypothetical protein